MKKKLNIDLIQSELRGGSAFFPGYKGRDSESPTPASQKAQAEADPVSSQVSKPFHPDRTPRKSSAQKTEVPIRSSVGNQGVPPPVPRTVPRTGSPTDHLTPKVKRPMKQRQPFDIYEDQYARLKDIADSERGFVNGRGLSQMVRDAIDAYLESNNVSSVKK
jgi:hypothetical protein